MSIVEKYSHCIWTIVHYSGGATGLHGGTFVPPVTPFSTPILYPQTPQFRPEECVFLSPINIVLTVISSRVISTLVRLQWSHLTSRCLLWQSKSSGSGHRSMVNRNSSLSSAVFILRWQHWRPCVTGCKEADVCKRWFRQRSLVSGQRTPFCGHPISVEPGEVIVKNKISHFLWFTVYKDIDKMLSYRRETALQGAFFTKNRRLELGDNILRTL